MTKKEKWDSFILTKASAVEHCFSKF